MPAGVAGFRLELRAGAGSLAAASVLGAQPSTHTSCLQGPGFLLSQGFRVCRDSAPDGPSGPWLLGSPLGAPGWVDLGGSFRLSQSSPPRPPLGLPRGPRAGLVGCVATNQGRVSRHRLPLERVCVCGQLLTSSSTQDGKPRGKAGVERGEGRQGEADVEQNNGTPSQDTAVTDSKRTADPKNAWQDANPADPGGRPHLIRLFSRDAPGREDNTFKDRPSESDELQTIQEDSAATPEGLDVMASQKRPSQRHGSKYLASASAMDHARHAFLPRHRDTGILDSLGRFFGGDRGVPKRGSGKDGHHAARTAHYGSLPQKPQHGRPQDENPVVHFFKNIVTPRTPPPSQGKGGEGQKPGFGYGRRAPAHKGLKGAHDAQGTLSKIFKLGGRDSRSGSPMARR
ncbi:myelin basic protein isoform X3 [Mustela erminea]|nr:myelin basic protein isoform X3 [Mustela erminea]